MAPGFFRNFFGLVLLTTVVAPQAYQTSSLETTSIASRQLVIDPANIVLSSSSQLTSQSKSCYAGRLSDTLLKLCRRFFKLDFYQSQ